MVLGTQYVDWSVFIMVLALGVIIMLYHTATTERLEEIKDQLQVIQEQLDNNAVSLIVPVLYNHLDYGIS